jgi:hypothetical protein
MEKTCLCKLREKDGPNETTANSEVLLQHYIPSFVHLDPHAFKFVNRVFHIISVNVPYLFNPHTNRIICI